MILFPRGFTNAKSPDAGKQWSWMKKEFPAITALLEPFKERAEKRYDKGEHWWELRACDYYDEFEKPKIVYAEIAARGQFAFDEDKYFADTTVYILGSDSKYLLYLLGIFNSRLWTFLFSHVSSTIRGGFFRWKFQYMSSLPIRTINFDDPADVIRHNQMVSLVDQMLELNKKLAESNMPQATEMLKRQIESTDKQIDDLVYKLYDLTDEEIKMVESKG